MRRTLWLFSLLLPVFGTTARASAETPVLTFTALSQCGVAVPVSADDQAWRKLLTEPVAAAEGRRVRITGYMWPVALNQGRVTEFLLMRNQNGCCYGQMPSANEFLVSVSTAPLPSMMDVPLVVEGTLRISPVAYGNTVAELFRLEDVTIVR